MSKKDKEELTKKNFPVSRIGNTNNPRLIILLENSNSHPEKLKLNPEYTMRLDGVFEPMNKEKDEHMDLNTFKEYDKWWDKLWTSCLEPCNLKTDDILALEYYPYFTYYKEKGKEIYNKSNYGFEDDYAKKAREKNLRLLVSAIDQEIPIFVYYKSGWFDFKYKNGISIYQKLKKVNKYVNFYDFERADGDKPINYRGSKMQKLNFFLDQGDIKNRFKKLKEEKYDLEDLSK